ncbi:Alpha-L-fucosidase [Posidoniimonas corsicana]|uniref:alpha-L-fucosidase n=1 Tax=Posidoniimonas corsicana TaxID=1938618 RepID=A0A5C5VCN6_9BACT|nr:alpha-L-fucosidase [Posidoniimonas corsicana]TWT35395.1 Alpha-L-fucosidase [Posidoniimonas corsicana]
MQYKQLIAFALLLAPMAPSLLYAETLSKAAPSSSDRMDWWRDAKFGMFVHWGIYSVTGGEYKGQKLPNSAEWMMARGKIPVAEYERYAGRFNPTSFDADAFVKLAKDAGMKYLVITAKHHDGFSMFDSDSNDFNVVDSTPFQRDIMKELSVACQNQGIRFGFYYSQAQDWRHPGGFGNGWDKSIRRVSNDTYVDEKAVPEVRQLLTEYGPIAIFWWDTPRRMTRESFDKLHSLTGLQPNTITNDRLGDDYPGDYKTFERHIPKDAPGAADWEVCMPISGSWGYKRSDTDFKSATTLIRNLADIASKGGNYLLNVSPTGEGTLLPQAVERLEEIGEWMRTNGDSIYGTTASPLGQLEWGRCTMRRGAGGARLYLHIFDWPTDGQLLIPGLKTVVDKAYLLDGGDPVDVGVEDQVLTLGLPLQAPSTINSVVVLETRGNLKVEPQGATARPDGSLVLTAGKAFLHNNEGAPAIRIQRHGKVQNLGYWKDAQAWVEWSVNIEQPGKYDVCAELATGEGDSQFEIGVPGKMVATTAAETGSYHKYANRRLGTISIDSAGNHQLQIKPLPGGWTPVNLRQVELRPVAQQ